MTVDPEKFARYRAIQDVLDGSCDQTLVRLLGKLTREGQRNIVSDDEYQIECVFPDSVRTDGRYGSLVQVIGTVNNVSPLPIVAVRIIRAMNGVDVDSYNFAVTKFNEFVQ